MEEQPLLGALPEGAPGLILIGCDPEACHHSYGIDHAWNRVSLIKKLFSLCGFDRRRIALAHADLNKPEEFVKTANAFIYLIRTLGPIEKTQANQDKLFRLRSGVEKNYSGRLVSFKPIHSFGKDTTCFF